MCCKLFEIRALAKPASTWCGHCAVGSGCTIYDARPQECRDFFCQYRLDANVAEHWKPSRSRMAMKPDPSGEHITVSVDPQRPSAWREAPYYQDLKAWAAAGFADGRQVNVRIGSRVVVVLPDCDVDLGMVGDRTILTSKHRSPQGRVVRMEFEVVDSDHPRALAAQAAAPAVVRR